jgi:hypothetical protein
MGAEKKIGREKGKNHSMRGTYTAGKKRAGKGMAGNHPRTIKYSCYKFYNRGSLGYSIVVGKNPATRGYNYTCLGSLGNTTTGLLDKASPKVLRQGHLRLLLM